MVYRYIDDTFAVFNDEDKCNEFFSHLNSLHSLLRFTFEKECNRTLPFLDVLVEKNDHEFVTSFYRKPTFICWNSFCPMKRKTNLISTLVHRALVIYSKSTLQNELSNICSILMNNGYPEGVINAVMTKKINQFHRPTQVGPKKCPVYLHLPWLGNISMRYKMQIKTAVKRCYFAVEPCIVYTTRQLLFVAKKDVLPAFHQSNIVYQFLCHCDSRYMGRTSQRLQQRIKHHVPKTILQEHISQDRSTLARPSKPIRSFKAETSFSAIGQHLLQNPTCAREYNDNKFSILARGRTSFHLSTLEATYIKTKFMQTKGIRLWSKNHALVVAPFIGRFLYQSRCSFCPFFLFRQLCLYISNSLHLFTLFLTDSLEKCQTKSFENEYSTFCNSIFSLLGRQF